MPDPAAAERIDSLLEGLNDPQRRAVVHGEGPLLILAGAGSGKTRVLTHRIAFLIHTGQVRPGEILAITFTNKAAQEMRERVELLLGHSTRAMWVMTFHAACARILRAEAPRLGYTRQFTIYDAADSRRLTKRCLDEIGADTKRFTPSAVHHQISDAKNKLRDPDTYRQMVGSFFEQTVADAYEAYQRELHRMNAMDFDDLLCRTVDVLQLFPEVRARYAATFRHVLVDEYQDTNHAQYRLLQLLAGEGHRNLAVVGDDAQCLVAGTAVTMADGSTKGIEEVKEGEWVLSAVGGGSFAPAQVTATHRAHATEAVVVTTRAGRVLTSTPEHTHLARVEMRLPLTERAQDATRRRDGVDLVLSAGPGRARHAVRAHGGTALVEDFGDAARLATSLHGRTRVAAALAETGDDFLFLSASSLKPGMTLMAHDGDLDEIVDVRRTTCAVEVHDLDVAGSHTFVANGLVTHNSIYSFRGADVRNILEFNEEFEDAEVVKLEQNYRSTQTILDVANGVISHNRGQMTKHLWTDVGQGDPVKVRELEDEHAEARFVVGEIERLVDEGVSRSEVAVFYRTNAQSRVLEDTLVRREVAYQVVGGTKFYDRAEVKDAMAYLTVLANPQDVVAFTRVANSPRRGIGQTSLSRVISHAATMGISVWEAAADAQGVPGLGTAGCKAFSRFMDTMTGLRDRARENVPVGDLLEAVLHESGYLDALEMERTIEAEGRIENLEALVEAAREFDAAAGTRGADEDTLDVFLQQTALVADADTRRDDEGLVTLMTLHNAKGLEYPIVFMIGCEEGVFPHSRSIDEGSLEEERRLMYVGITRAMRDLYLTYARRRSVYGGSPNIGLPSRFLAELPTDLIDRQGSSASTWGAAAVAAGNARARMTSWATGGGGNGGGGDRGGSAEAAPSFFTGQDVVHAAFGEGVVTGMEPGGIVVIRFADDGSERKLMAEYAPITARR